MFTLTPQQALLIGFIVAPILFALCAFFIHANVRRIAGALVGAAAHGAINYGWDQVADRPGWWSYPASLGTGYAPLTLHVLASIIGGAMGLIGWRTRLAAVCRYRIGAQFSARQFALPFVSDVAIRPRACFRGLRLLCVNKTAKNLSR